MNYRMAAILILAVLGGTNEDVIAACIGDTVLDVCVEDIPRDELVMLVQDDGATMADISSAVRAVQRSQPGMTTTVRVPPLDLDGVAVVWTVGQSAELPAHLSSVAGMQEVRRPRVLTPLDQGFKLPPTDPYYGNQWGLDAINAPEAWGASIGRGVVVGVIDTGIDCGHADVGKNCTESVMHYDGLSRRWIEKTAVVDPLGHGTHVAGIIAAPPDGRGIVGVAPAALLISFRACTASGRCSELDILAAVVASYGRAHVINMSLGGNLSGNTRLLCEAIGTARDEYGMTAVAAVGNQGRPVVMYPAGCPGVIGVGATVPPTGRKLADYSQRAAVDVSAPGSSILSTWPGGGYRQLNGTSMAAPHVAGVAALLYEAMGPDRTDPDKVTSLIRESADPFCGESDRDPVTGGRLCGYGQVDANRAVRLVLPDVDNPTATDEPTAAVTVIVTSTLEAPTGTPTPCVDIGCIVATARVETATAGAKMTAVGTATPTARPTASRTAAPTSTTTRPADPTVVPPADTPTVEATPTPTPCPDLPVVCAARATVTARAVGTATARAVQTAVAATLRVPTSTGVPPIETLVSAIETAAARGRRAYLPWILHDHDGLTCPPDDAACRLRLRATEYAREETATAAARQTSGTPDPSETPDVQPRPLSPVSSGVTVSPRLTWGGAGGWCHVAPMGDGAYTAAHCLTRGRTPATADCDPCAWSVDAGGRDLAHVVAAIDSGVSLYPPSVGDVLYWANTRAAGALQIAETAMELMTHYSGKLIGACALDTPIVRGDSGTGAYAPGARLGGIIAYADMGGIDANPAFCHGEQQRVWLVGVP